MRWWFYFALLSVLSCSNDELETYTNLQEYMSLQNEVDVIDVIACAASDRIDSDKTYIFFYPVLGATEIKYFETETTEVDKNNFSLYKEIELPKEPVFNGYLERFVRISDAEVWSIVTYKVNGVLRSAQPIRLKQQTKQTEWTNTAGIDFTENTKPIFSWSDGMIDENEIYFQVIADSENYLLSGTYTYDAYFQYYNLENVVLNVTRDRPPKLFTMNNYNFTLMAVSIDNWVNLVVQKEFLIPNVQ